MRCHGTRAVLAGCAVFVVLKLLAAAMPDAWYAVLFCRAPAALVAAYFHAGIDGTSLTLGSGRVVAVTRSCGGSDFFALACAVLTWHGLRQKDAARVPLWCFGAWAFTLLVNGMRLIVTVWTRALAEPVLPERFYGAVHLVSGVLVFFPALLLLWWVCLRHDGGRRDEAENPQSEP